MRLSNLVCAEGFEGRGVEQLVIWFYGESHLGADGGFGHLLESLEDEGEGGDAQ